MCTCVHLCDIHMCIRAIPTRATATRATVKSPESEDLIRNAKVTECVPNACRVPPHQSTARRGSRATGLDKQKCGVRQDM